MTIRELRGVLGQPEIALKTNTFSVPPEAQCINPFELPVSARLANLLTALQVSRLGDLDGYMPRELLGVNNCGRVTVRELESLLDQVAAGEFKTPAGPFRIEQTAQLLRLLDASLAKLCAPTGEIMRLRLEPGTAGIMSLEQAGRRFNLTKERIRQIERRSLFKIKQLAGPELGHYLRGVANTCQESVCPLTPRLLRHWLGEDAAPGDLSPAAYVRLLGKLDSGIQAWPLEQEPHGASDANDPITATIVKVLQEHPPALPIPMAFKYACDHLGRDNLSFAQFLQTLKHSRSLAVDFAESSQGIVRIRIIRSRRLQFLDAIKAVLSASQVPLPPEEIWSKANALTGGQPMPFSKRSFDNSRFEKFGIFKLGRNVFGLPSHIRLPGGLWEQARNVASLIIRTNKRPTPTWEMLAMRDFDWAAPVNKHELAYVLRGDKRLAYLGYFHFGLSKWRGAARQKIKELVPGILARAGKPLTSSQIIIEVRRVRPVGTNSITSSIRRATGVCDCGCGCFGLSSWDDSIKKSIKVRPRRSAKRAKKDLQPTDTGRSIQP